MHATHPLYYDDSYGMKATATVMELGAYRGNPFAILDSTIFYPEGGGQPGDRGDIGSSTVVDTVYDDDGRILHLLTAHPAFKVGDTVEMQLDWSHRYDYMVQHTAQHLLSGLLHHMLGIGTVSVHLGHEDLSIEADAEELEEKDIEKIEDAANKVIREAVAVSAVEVTREDALEMGLRRSVKVDGDVRIVRIGEYDTIACGGVHVADTSELRFVQYLRSEKIRGHLKTYWVAGDRAIAMVRRNRRIVDEAGTLLSMPPEEIPNGITLLQKQLSEQRYQGNLLALRLAATRLDFMLQGKDYPLVAFDASNWSDDEFKALPETILDKAAIALCAVKSRDDGRLAWMVALKGTKNDVALFQTIRSDLLPLIEGKGGGKPPLWQGVGNDASKKTEFLERVELLLREDHDGQEE